jgi:hypothetical protein
MKKLEYKLLPCILCTIGVSCYVTGHNLIHASVQKLTNHRNNALTNNKEGYAMTENLPLESKVNSSISEKT